MPLWSRLQRRHTRPPLRTRNEAPRHIDDTVVLERLFRERPDPWDFLIYRYEQACLTKLGSIVQRVPHASVLEIGCAEGVFTAWLTTVAEHVVALDVSPTACARAHERAPKATVLAQGLGSYISETVFDLVVCTETLYYMYDPGAALTAMRQLGKYVFVSYTRHERQRLDPLLAGMSAVVDEEFTYVVRRFPPKKRGCRSFVWGPPDSMLPTLNTSWAARP